ncbi:tetratricopeptide repeat protein [Bradyrhizobium sp. HKCCYLS2038]|uniref:tetratricopeptide repeat protein n=1 Tax=unclassified Bradyrhizobium TaxID=2631580 RepID=UPI003EBA36E1
MIWRIIIGPFILALACVAAAQSVANASDASWNECLLAPRRACILREAAEVAGSIGDAHLSARELGEIAKAQLKAGLFTEAAATIDLALQVAKSIAKDSYDRDGAFETIAQVQAQAGKLADALETAKSIENRHVQAAALGAIAVAEGNAGRLDDALRRVEAIEDLPDRALIMRRVTWDLRASAVARGEDDKIVAALQTVLAVEERYPPPIAMTGVHHPSKFIPALAIIAQAQTRAGKVAEAMRVARLVSRSMERAQAFAAIGVALARAGAVGSALQVARSIDDRWERGIVLGSLLEPRLPPDLIADEPTTSGSPVKSEVPNNVRDFVTAFTDREQRATVLCLIAMALANNGRLDEAIALAEPIDQDKPRAFAWHAIAKAQAKAGMATQSIASFERAVQAASSFQPNDGLLSKIAVSQADADQIDEALHVTRLIGGTMATAGYVSQVMSDGKLVNADHDRRFALRAIAKAQARAGRMADAFQNASALRLGPEIIPPGLGVVAEGLAEAGRIAEAIDAATAEDNLYRRSKLLASIAKAQAEAGRIDQAKQVMQHVTWGPEQVEALASIGGAQAKAGLTADALASFTEAMQIAYAQPYKNTTAEALVMIAGRLSD